MNKAYSRVVWQNYPSLNTPLNEQNLNRMDTALDEVDNRVITLDVTKFNVIDAQTLIKNFSLNETTGIITITYQNGSTQTIQTSLSKIPDTLDFDPIKQEFVIVHVDGTTTPVDLSAVITQNEFTDSDTVDFQLLEDGSVTAIVKEGSIEEKHLRPNYLADIKLETSKAQASATAAESNANKAEDQALLSKSWAIGDTGARDGEDTDNSKYYSEQSKASADTSKEYLTKVEKAGEDAVKAVQDALDISAPEFIVDLSTGHLMYSGGRFDFQVNSGGHLLWGLTV